MMVKCAGSFSACLDILSVPAWSRASVVVGKFGAAGLGGSTAGVRCDVAAVRNSGRNKALPGVGGSAAGVTLPSSRVGCDVVDRDVTGVCSGVGTTERSVLSVRQA